MEDQDKLIGVRDCFHGRTGAFLPDHTEKKVQKSLMKKLTDPIFKKYVGREPASSDL